MKAARDPDAFAGFSAGWTGSKHRVGSERQRNGGDTAGLGSSPQGEWPGGTAAITLFFEDLEAVRGFYAEVFGLTVVYEDYDSAVFRFGDTLINLLRASEASSLVDPAPVAPPTAGVRFQLTLGVEDVDTVCARLVRRGVALLNGPMDRPWGVRTASFRDPGGHIWEIAH